MIYAIHAVGTNYIKFGKAGNVKRRLQTLQGANPHELRVICEADWPDDAEALIHKLLTGSKARGEWFGLDKLAVNILALMRDEDGLNRLSALHDKQVLSAGREALKAMYHVTKEDFGIWRTNAQWAN